MQPTNFPSAPTRLPCFDVCLLCAPQVEDGCSIDYIDDDLLGSVWAQVRHPLAFASDERKSPGDFGVGALLHQSFVSRGPWGGVHSRI